MGGFLALIFVYLACIAATAFFLKKRMEEFPDKWDSLPSAMFEIAFRNVFDLRDQLATCVGFLPYFWAVLMKQLIPQVILILFINLAQSKNGDGDPLFGNYGGYISWPFQVMGYLVVVFAGFLFLLGLVVPNAYNGLTLIDEKFVFADGDDVKEPSETGPEGTEKQEKIDMMDEEEVGPDTVPVVHAEAEEVVA